MSDLPFCVGFISYNADIGVSSFFAPWNGGDITVGYDPIEFVIGYDSKSDSLIVGTMDADLAFSVIKVSRLSGIRANLTDFVPEGTFQSNAHEYIFLLSPIYDSICYGAVMTSVHSEGRDIFLLNCTNLADSRSSNPLTFYSIPGTSNDFIQIFNVQYLSDGFVSVQAGVFNASASSNSYLYGVGHPLSPSSIFRSSGSPSITQFAQRTSSILDPSNASNTLAAICFEVVLHDTSAGRPLGLANCLNSGMTQVVSMTFPTGSAGIYPVKTLTGSLYFQSSGYIMCEILSYFD